MTICRNEVVINLETGVVAARPLEAYPEPFGKAMCNAMTTAVESALKGGYIGGYMRDAESGEWTEEVLPPDEVERRGCKP